MNIAARDDALPPHRMPAGGSPARNRESCRAIGRRAVACALVAATLLASCATAPRLEPPKVVVEGVRIDRLTPADARFAVVVAIANPNDREIAVEAIDADVRIEGVPVGSVHLASPVRLPARGAATAELATRATLSRAFEAAAAILRRAEGAGALQPVRYAVSGTATIDGGNPIPFSREGEIAWPRGGAASP